MSGEKGQLTPRETWETSAQAVEAQQALGCGKRLPHAQQNIPKKSPPFLGELEQSAVIADYCSVLIAIRTPRLSIIATA